MDPTLPLDRNETELWADFITQEWPVAGQCSDRCHVVSVGQGGLNAWNKQRQPQAWIQN